jgi:hypothetical protein
MANEIPDYDDPGPDDYEHIMQQKKRQSVPTTQRPYPNEMSRTVTHPDGFVEFDEEVFPDPERDQIMADTMRALREAVAKRAAGKQ